MKKVMLEGNFAAAEAMRLARIGVVSAYPITPQSPIAEVLSEYTGDGRLDAKYIRVESEHTAMSVAIGAQLTGVRTGTATSSVGLALMFEMLGVAAGLRLPIVMPVVNRALVSPWSLWCDHQDSMAARDTGWMQLYAEDCQDVLDLCLIAYRAAENGDVLVPTMVCMDGFFLSHMSQAVYVPSQQDVDDFLPPYQAKNLKLDIADPMFVNNLIPPTEFMEMRYQQHTGFSNALPVLNTAMKEFETQFGRSHSPIEPYCCDDAEAILISLGSMSGSVKEMVDQYRAQGKKVGNLKIVSFRPFPEEDLVAAIPRGARVGVLDRSMSMGAPAGPVCNDVRSAISNQGLNVRIQGFVVGLGGRDVRPVAITSAFDRLLAGQYDKDVQWLDMSDNAMTLRQYREAI
ncbi:pyruvate ferredoxin oxidoreductase [Desulfopila aestuarii]|uniref:Pyruvate ferredoxin oxidoreductase, alpha subunit n=1 Tax=Desulfopila aestuarii DSM 18488 TaxID=1121416 RepID=A0A1M7Y6M6_9BACT|nr:pyruvate ferredoxin oxidoreductase [Desulfopila aestuarii]SHO48166.1 pyruvate ferredoxin oxidoreductase, alpha subunit [Desulfopila aestuarii DSM 18488]